MSGHLWFLSSASWCTLTACLLGGSPQQEFRAGLRLVLQILNETFWLFCSINYLIFEHVNIENYIEIHGLQRCMHVCTYNHTMQIYTELLLPSQILEDVSVKDSYFKYAVTVAFRKQQNKWRMHCIQGNLELCCMEILSITWAVSYY